MSEPEIIFELDPGRYVVEVLRLTDLEPVVASRHTTADRAKRAATALYDMEDGKRYVRVVDTQPDAVRAAKEKLVSESTQSFLDLLTCMIRESDAAEPEKPGSDAPLGVHNEWGRKHDEWESTNTTLRKILANELLNEHLKGANS